MCTAKLSAALSFILRAHDKGEIGANADDMSSDWSQPLLKNQRETASSVLPPVRNSASARYRFPEPSRCLPSSYLWQLASCMSQQDKAQTNRLTMRASCQTCNAERTTAESPQEFHPSLVAWNSSRRDVFSTNRYSMQTPQCLSLMTCACCTMASLCRIPTLSNTVTLLLRQEGAHQAFSTTLKPN